MDGNGAQFQHGLQRIRNIHNLALKLFVDRCSWSYNYIVHEVY